MARKSWSFVDAKVRAADLLCFVVVGAYLTVICGYLLATRRLSADGSAWAYTVWIS